MRPVGAAAIGRGDRYGCSCTREIVVERGRDARSCAACHASDITDAVTRAAGQFLGQRGQVPDLLRHARRHNLRRISGQAMLERRTRRRVSTFAILFPCFPTGHPAAGNRKLLTSNTPITPLAFPQVYALKSYSDPCAHATFYALRGPERDFIGTDRNDQRRDSSG